MRNNHFSIWTMVGGALLISLLAGCTTTTINARHELIQHNTSSQSEYAKVYFIRPGTEHMQGFPDNPLKVLVNNQQLLTLGKSEYTLLYLKPHQSNVTLENLTQLRGRWEVETIKRTRTFDFEAGHTYFLITQPVDGEFRGVHFMPELVPQIEAKAIAKRLRPVGEAKKKTIESL